METEILKKQIEEQLDRFENAVELPFNEELSEQMKFVRDGILDVEKYLNADVKILYILKEAHSKENDLSDMRENLIGLNGDDPNRIDANWGATWRPIAYATYGIFEKKNFQDMPDINGNAAEVLKHLPKIAHINVKKFAGGARANEKEIRNFYNQYKDLLHEQIEMINPDVLVFCGTLGFFDDKHFSKWGEITYIDDSQGNFDKYKCGSKLFISAYHPNQTKISQELYCNSIINAVKIKTC